MIDDTPQGAEAIIELLLVPASRNDEVAILWERPFAQTLVAFMQSIEADWHREAVQHLAQSVHRHLTKSHMIGMRRDLTRLINMIAITHG